MATETLRYRLLSGGHIENDMTGKERRYSQGEVFESNDKNLLRFNAPGMAPKFEQVNKQTPIGRPNQGDSIPAPTAIVTTNAISIKDLDTLQSMNVKELTAWAAEEEINLGAAKSKDEILKAIKEQIAS